MSHVSPSRIAYLDLPSGISGDMFLGCLVDAGWPVDDLRATIVALGLPEERWRIAQERVMRGPLAATLLRVDAEEDTAHRHLPDVEAIIRQANLPVPVVQRAIAVFRRLAEAEAAVHGASIDSVHFHEVGAIDAIIDIVGVCAGLYALGIERLYAGSVPLGEGWTRSAHGRIPLPAPATLALLTAVNAPTRPAPGPGELVTPTGAALLAELATFTQPPMRLVRIGLGAGRKEFAWPNVARLWLADALDPASGSSHAGDGATKSLTVLEANIDDMNPEHFAPASEKLFAAGALDVWLTPIQMKKGRPGVLFSVLGEPDNADALSAILLRETTTLGLRRYAVERTEVQRRMTTVPTPYGEVRVKIKVLGGQEVGGKPEYDDCLRLAQAHDVPIQQVFAAALAAFTAPASV